MEMNTWCIKWCGPNDWQGCEPGYYWGALEDADAGEVTLGDTTGPFETAADAALNMVRTWAIQSAERKGVN